MNNTKLDQNILNLLTNILPGFKFAYLFGSRAQGTENSMSDYDIAVYFNLEISPEQCFYLAQELAANFNADVDLVDLRRANDVLKVQIIDKGEVLVSNDESARKSFEMYAYADYARLNEERRDILEDFYK